MTTQQYTCNWRVRHNGTLHAAQASIDLDPDVDAELVASGAVSLAAASAASAPVALDPDEQLALVVASINQLTPGNEAHWTKGGKPECPALSERCGFAVSAKLRDAAWAQHQAVNAGTGAA